MLTDMIRRGREPKDFNAWLVGTARNYRYASLLSQAVFLSPRRALRVARGACCRHAFSSLSSEGIKAQWCLSRFPWTAPASSTHRGRRRTPGMLSSALAWTCPTSCTPPHRCGSSPCPHVLDRTRFKHVTSFMYLRKSRCGNHVPRFLPHAVASAWHL